MDQIGQIDLGRKSWTAYVGIFLFTIGWFLVVPVVAWSFSWIWGTLSALIMVIFLIHKILLLRSYNLFFDKEGIWIKWGFLPWQKGLAGVKWRDLDGAVCYQTMTSWLFKSYTIRVGHRFTRSSEIFLRHIKNGHFAMAQINSHHDNLIRHKKLH